MWRGGEPAAESHVEGWPERSRSPRKKAIPWRPWKRTSPPRHPSPTRDPSPSPSGAPQGGWQKKRRGSHEDTFFVPASLCTINRILGCRGSRVMKLEKASGAKIDVKPAGEEHMIRMYGSEISVEKARALIDDLLDEIRTQDTEENIKVSQVVVSRLIGSGGRTIQKLQEDSGATVDIDMKAVPPTVNIRGSRDSVLTASEMIYDLVGKFQFTESHDTLIGGTLEVSATESIEVPGSMIKRVMGRGGQTIMRLETETGTKIDVVKPTGDPTKIKISGPNDAIVRAIDRITDLITETDGDLRHEETIEFPQAVAGKLIGPAGAQIQELQEQSGCTIGIEDQGTRCSVRISGSVEQIVCARTEIRKIVEQPSGTQTEILELPLVAFVKLVGVGGEVVKRMRRVTGARIRVDKFERECKITVTMSGTAEQIESAKREVERAQHDEGPLDEVLQHERALGGAAIAANGGRAPFRPVGGERKPFRPSSFGRSGKQGGSSKAQPRPSKAPSMRAEFTDMSGKHCDVDAELEDDTLGVAPRTPPCQPPNWRPEENHPATW